MAEELVKIEGMKEIEQLLKGLPALLKGEALQKGLTTAATIIAKSAKARAPARTGKLKQSIRTRKGPGDFFTVQRYVYAGAYYGLFIEKGYWRTARGQGKMFRGEKRKGRKRGGKKRISQVGARPFMRPALEENKQQVLNAVGVGVKRAIARMKKAGRV